MDRLARGKKSIAVNLKHAEGQSIIRKLTSNADVILDPFRPGLFLPSLYNETSYYVQVFFIH